MLEGSTQFKAAPSLSRSLAIATYAAVAVCLAAPLGAGQSARYTPNPFEQFANQAGTQVVWSVPAGELESSHSHALVTAVVLANNAATQGQTMKGVRIDLRHLDLTHSCDSIFRLQAVLCAAPSAALWFEQNTLNDLRVGLARGNYDNLIVSYRSSRPLAKATGLLLGGYDFDGRAPDDLTALIEQANRLLFDAQR